MLPVLLAALKVLVIAGGGEAAENHNSHAVHVRGLTELLAERGVPATDVTVFWADGKAPGPDRAVVPDDRLPGEWLILGTPLDAPTEPGPILLNTEFAGLDVRPAKRSELAAWLAKDGARLGASDTLLIAVTDHGEPDPDGGLNSRITLWGESLSAEDLMADLKPVKEEVRVVLWMSQCYSGGFGDAIQTRQNACGAFSANADRPSYGCYPELASRQGIGHFAKMIEGFRAFGALGPASDLAMLEDDTPDTPHLTSDALLYEAILAAAESQGTPPERLLDARLAEVSVDAPEWGMASDIASRYGLGVVRDYSSTLDVLDELDQLRYALETWAEAWNKALSVARTVIAEPLLSRIQEQKVRAARLKRRAEAIALLDEASRARPGQRERMEALWHKAQTGDELAERLDLHEAAALRLAYLYVRLAGPALLDVQDRARFRALKACEAEPLFAKGPEPDADRPQPLPPATRLEGEIETLRPGYLGIAFRDLPDFAGIEVQQTVPGSPGRAAKLRPGDRIVGVNGRKLERRGRFREAVLLAEPGQPTNVEVHRGKKTSTVTLVSVPAPLPARPPVIGEVVPDLRLVPFEPGRRLPIVGARQPVVLFFFATWCPSCRDALPELKAWATRRNAAVLAITREDREAVRRALGQGTPFPFPIGLDQEGEASRLFQVEQPPVFVYVDENGRFVDDGEGFTGEIPLSRVAGRPRPHR